MPPKSLSTPRKKKRLCDDIWRKLIVSHGVCERCQTRVGPFEAAHIVRRRYSWTRTYELNGWCLCHACHATVDTIGTEFNRLVHHTIGTQNLVELERRSLNRAKFDWFAEHERLKALVRPVPAQE